MTSHSSASPVLRDSGSTLQPFSLGPGPCFQPMIWTLLPAELGVYPSSGPTSLPPPILGLPEWARWGKSVGAGEPHPLDLNISLDHVPAARIVRQLTERRCWTGEITGTRASWGCGEHWVARDWHRKCPVSAAIRRSSGILAICPHTPLPSHSAPQPCSCQFCPVTGTRTLLPACSSEPSSCLAWTVVPPALPLPASSLSFENKSDILARVYGRGHLSQSGPSSLHAVLTPLPPHTHTK